MIEYDKNGYAKEYTFPFDRVMVLLGRNKQPNDTGVYVIHKNQDKCVVFPIPNNDEKATKVGKELALNYGEGTTLTFEDANGKFPDGFKDPTYVVKNGKLKNMGSLESQIKKTAEKVTKKYQSRKLSTKKRKVTKK